MTEVESDTNPFSSDSFEEQTELHHKNPLQFQDFGNNDAYTTNTDRLDDSQDLLTDNQATQPSSSSSTASTPNPSIFSLNYYRAFFEVTTSQILHRLMKTLFPFSGPFLNDHDPKPDLYGPFWIATTLIFLTTATANMADYITSTSDWKYDFNKMTVAASLFYCFISVIPVIAWWVLDHCGLKTGFGTVLCLFGYSLFPFLPSAVLCVIPLEALRWICLLISTTLSLTFLLSNLLRLGALIPEKKIRCLYNIRFHWRAVSRLWISNEVVLL